MKTISELLALALLVPRHTSGRTHDIDILRDNSNGAAFRAVINHIHPIGPIVRLELSREAETELIEAELSRE